MYRGWVVAALAMCFCALALAQPEPRVEDFSTAAACEATAAVPVARKVDSPGWLLDVADPSRRFESCFGAFYGRQAVLERCARAGADFNKPCDGATVPGLPRRALDFAIERGDPAAVRVLLDSGADIKLTREPIKLLVQHCGDALVPRCRDIVTMLLAHGASLEEGRPYDTPVTLSWDLGNRQMALALVDMGADINAASIDGCTALNRALDNRDKEGAGWLESKGAKASAACSAKHTARRLVDYASVVGLVFCIFGGCNGH